MLYAVKHSLAVIAAYRCRCARFVGLVWQIHHLKPARCCAPPQLQIFEFLGYAHFAHDHLNEATLLNPLTLF
jgi:hypothetical protein